MQNVTYKLHNQIHLQRRRKVSNDDKLHDVKKKKKKEEDQTDAGSHFAVIDEKRERETLIL